MTVLAKTEIWHGITEGVRFDGLHYISFFGQGWVTCCFNDFTWAH